MNQKIRQLRAGPGKDRHDQRALLDAAEAAKRALTARREHELREHGQRG
jgi:hypothetical protein